MENRFKLTNISLMSWNRGRRLVALCNQREESGQPLKASRIALFVLIME